jgi:hypothetical protein
VHRIWRARPDSIVAKEIRIALQPIAVEAAIVAEREALEQVDEQRRAFELELQQAQYDVKIAERRYQPVDPDNRLALQNWQRGGTRR